MVLWPKVFQGIYFILAQQAYANPPPSLHISQFVIFLYIIRHAERAVLYELANLSSKQADILVLDANMSLQEMEKNRLQLRGLVNRLLSF